MSATISYSIRRPSMNRSATVSELKIKKVMREQEKISKAFKIRIQLEEDIRAHKQEAQIKIEQETHRRLQKITEIKETKEKLETQNRERELDIEKKKKIKYRKLHAKSSINRINEANRRIEEKKKHLIELKQKQLTDEKRFNDNIADKAVLIYYKRLPTILSLLKSCSLDSFE